jgi:acyl-CoA thioesterase I
VFCFDVSPLQRRLHQAARVGAVALCALLLCAAVLLAPLRQPARAAGTLRIMPLGDSITQGNAAWGPTYRYVLWHALADAGLRADFVGSITATISGGYQFADFDQQHEGHNGWRVDQINAALPGFLTAAQPDVLLVHLGHNDLIQGQSAASTVDELALLIDLARAARPSISVLLAQPIPCVEASSFCRAPELADLSARLPAMIAQKDILASRVLLVDMRTGFSPTADLVDGLHPNAAGDAKLAARWLSGLRALALVPTPTPLITPAVPTLARPTITPTATHTASPTTTPTATHTASPTTTATRTPVVPTLMVPVATATVAPSTTPSAREPLLEPTLTATPAAVPATAPVPVSATPLPAPSATVLVFAPGRPDWRVWVPVVVANGNTQ